LQYTSWETNLSNGTRAISMYEYNVDACTTYQDLKQ